MSPWVRFYFPAIPSSVVDIVFGAGLVVVLSLVLCILKTGSPPIKSKDPCENSIHEKKVGS